MAGGLGCLQVCPGDKRHDKQPEPCFSEFRSLKRTLLTHARLLIECQTSLPVITNLRGGPCRCGRVRLLGMRALPNVAFSGDLLPGVMNMICCVGDMGTVHTQLEV